MPTDFAPHNMTTNFAPTPYVAWATTANTPAYSVFAGNAGNPWQGTGGGVDSLELDLGAGLTRFSPQNMTTDSAPSPFVASASSEYYNAFNAFNSDLAGANYWLGTGSGVDYLQLDTGSGNSYILGVYDIQVDNVPEPNRAPKNWTMQGSNNGSSWTTVDTQTNQTSWLKAQTRSYTAATQTTAYRYFRLSITANNGDATYTQVAQLSLYAAGISSTAQKLGSYAIQFSTNGAEPTNRGPKNWTLLGSNDGTTWTTTDTQTNQTGWTTGLTRTYTCATPSGTAFRFYEINITANNGDGTYTTIGQMYLYVAVSTFKRRLVLTAT
jgi:hypothetical protein